MFLQNLWHHFVDGKCLCEGATIASTATTTDAASVSNTSSLVKDTRTTTTNAIKNQWDRAVQNLCLKGWNGTTSFRDDPLVIHHVAQTETWDCGIACLLMVLQEDPSSLRKTQLMELIGTQSIWSMDLVHLIHVNSNSNMAHSLSYLFCSKTLQVDQEHRDLLFYRKAFDEDHVRVSNLFQRAQQEEWNLLEMDLQVHHVVELVKRPDCFAIALVDNTILQQYQFEKDCYAGHYVVVSGVTADGTQLRIHNPAKDEPVEYISISLFEKAWKAKGTDSDIIFLVRN